MAEATRQIKYTQRNIALCYVLIKQSDSPSPCQFSKDNTQKKITGAVSN